MTLREEIEKELRDYGYGADQGLPIEPYVDAILDLFIHLIEDSEPKETIVFHAEFCKQRGEQYKKCVKCILDDYKSNLLELVRGERLIEAVKGKYGK
mgnify:CR=1 FL=1